jgi:hypothetical protein
MPKDGSMTEGMNFSSMMVFVSDFHETLVTVDWQSKQQVNYRQVVRALEIPTCTGSIQVTLEYDKLAA